MLPRTPSIFLDPALCSRRTAATGVEPGSKGTYNLNIRPGLMSRDVDYGIHDKRSKIRAVRSRQNRENPQMTLLENELEVIQIAKTLYPTSTSLAAREAFLTSPETIRLTQAYDAHMATFGEFELSMYMNTLKSALEHAEKLLDVHMEEMVAQ